METRLTHRDASGGLFIGASMFVACANEFGTQLNCCISSFMQHFSHHWLPFDCSGAAMVAKKTPATTPASEYCFKKTKPFFEEKAALPD